MTASGAGGFGRLLDRVRPHPHRGDVIAAGAVPLALAAIVIELRMTQWSLGPRLVVVALISALLLLMGWLSPLEGESPRAYQSVLLVCGLIPLVVALVLLAEVLGAARPPGSGAQVWIFGAEALIATAAARHANSGVCTLIAALAFAIGVQALVDWAFAPQGPGTFRAMLVVLALFFGVAAVRLRDRRRRHAVQLVNAAGIVTLVLALTLLLGSALLVAFGRLGGLPSGVAGSGASFGWKLYLLAVGFGLVAYAAADNEPGPAYIGVAVLLAFAVLVGLYGGGRGSLVGWPLFLLVIGCAGLGIGLRPRRDLPPPPERGAAPTVPLHDTQGAGT